MKSLKIQLPGTSDKENPVVIPVKKSGGRGTLNLHDAIKGLLIAGIVGAGTTLYQYINDWLNHLPVNIEWMEVARAAVSAMMGYLSVNFFSRAKVVINASELEA